MLNTITTAKSFKTEAKKYDAKLETANIEFKACKHKEAKIVGREIRCGCGAAWSGDNLLKLFELLTK